MGEAERRWGETWFAGRAPCECGFSTPPVVPQWPSMIVDPAEVRDPEAKGTWKRAGAPNKYLVYFFGSNNLYAAERV